MTHGHSALAAGLFLAFAGACGDAPVRVEVPRGASESRAAPFPDDERAWLRYHSVRLRISVPLPDGKTWRIDDHSRPELVARHAASQSELVIASFGESELMNRATCEEKAREKNLVPTAALRTLEDGRTVGPAAYDTRLWVAIEAGKSPASPLTGHVLVFGALIRHCIFMHFSSEVPSGQDEGALSSRLAVAKVRLLGGLTLDPPRTTGDADVPREKDLKK